MVWPARLDTAGRESGLLTDRDYRAVFEASPDAMLISARETAEEMFLSPKTVESYLARAKTKLGLHTRRDVVRFALEAGLLKADGEP